jgi:dTDP-4-amino-4,6-dideoxygalactose transaminase
LKRPAISYANWSRAEYGAALRCLLTGGAIEGEFAAKLTARFNRDYFPSTAHTMNYAHAGIAIALWAFARRTPNRKQVLLPAYICPSVVQTIMAAGLSAVPVDVGSDLNMRPAAVAAAFTDNTLAVIAPHMFACPARIGEIAALCRDAKIFLIDDAAQVVGIRQDDRLLGTFGDVGVISFAQSKTIVTGIRGSGGILLVNNPEFEAEINAACAHLPVPTGRIGAFLDFCWNYPLAPYTGNSGYRLGRVGEMLGLRLSTSENSARISNFEARIALTQMDRLPEIHHAAIRTADAYHRELAGMQFIAFPQYAPGRFLSRIMLTLPAEIDLSVCRALLEDQHIGTRLGYETPFPPQKSTENARMLSRRLLGVPCGPGIAAAEVRHICQKLNEAVHTALHIGD